VIAELVAEAMLGPVTLEYNWLIITEDTHIFQNWTRLKSVTKEVFSDIQSRPPTRGFEGVEIAR